MRSVLRSVRKRKKSRRLGEVDIIRREEYAGFDVDAKVEMIRALVPLGLMHVQELLDDEVTELAGARHARKESLVRGRRHGSNPGTVRLAGQRVPLRVPRVRSVAGGEIPLRSYEAAREDSQVNDVLLKRVLYGISCRNYAAAAESVPGAIGLSSSTVSRNFIQASAATLREFQERDLSGEDVVALFLDGKAFADSTMVIALGITISGKKRFLGFVETDTETAQILAPFLRSLVDRGLDASQGACEPEQACSHGLLVGAVWRRPQRPRHRVRRRPSRHYWCSLCPVVGEERRLHRTESSSSTWRGLRPGSRSRRERQAARTPPRHEARPASSSLRPAVVNVGHPSSSRSVSSRSRRI